MSWRISDLFQNTLERVTGAIPAINTDHKYIHVGIGYKAHLEIGDLAAEASESFSFKTPANNYVHFKNLRLSGVGASMKAEIIFGTEDNELDVDSAGTTATELLGPHNLNDNSSNSTGIVIKKTPTYTDNKDGETWDLITISGASTNQFRSASQTQGGANEELVLKPDTYYVIKITNLSPEGGDAASDVNLTMFWYEEGDG